MPMCAFPSLLKTTSFPVTFDALFREFLSEFLKLVDVFKVLFNALLTMLFYHDFLQKTSVISTIKY